MGSSPIVSTAVTRTFPCFRLDGDHVGGGRGNIKGTSGFRTILAESCRGPPAGPLSFGVGQHGECVGNGTVPLGGGVLVDERARGLAWPMHDISSLVLAPVDAARVFPRSARPGPPAPTPRPLRPPSAPLSTGWPPIPIGSQNLDRARLWGQLST